VQAGRRPGDLLEEPWRPRDGVRPEGGRPWQLLVQRRGSRGDQGVIPAVPGQPGHRDRGAGHALPLTVGPLALSIFGGPVLDAPVPLAGTGAAHRQGAQEVVAQPAIGASGRHRHEHLRGGTSAGADDQHGVRARRPLVVSGPGQPPLVDDRHAVPRRRRIDARVVQQLAVGGVEALPGVVAQQDARPAERLVLDLLGGLPGHVADLPLYANPGRIHIFHLTERSVVRAAVTSYLRAVRHDDLPLVSSISGGPGTRKPAICVPAIMTMMARQPVHPVRGPTVTLESGSDLGLRDRAGRRSAALRRDLRHGHAKPGNRDHRPPGNTANGADMPIRTRQAPHPPFGSLSYAEARSSLARFAAEVAPALRELDPA